MKIRHIFKKSLRTVSYNKRQNCLNILKEPGITKKKNVIVNICLLR